MDNGIVALIVLAVAAIGGLLNWKKRLGAKNWPMITATVEQTCVDKEDRGFVPGILYSYQVNGEFYSGQYKFPESRGDPDTAREIVKPWLQKKIYIRYKPSDPQVSVLLPGDRPPG